MKEMKVLLDDDMSLLVLQATVLDEEGFTMQKVTKIYDVEKDVIDLRIKGCE